MSANLIVGKDPTGNKVPVAVDAGGKLQIGGIALDSLTVNTDQIEAKQDVTNALLTTQAADIATIKTPLSGVTQTSVSGKTGLDVNVISGGGGGGGGASGAYNATLPTYTSGASTTLQTDVNGRLITTGPELSTIASEAVIIDNKLPSLSSGRVPVEANNAASQVYNYTATGSVALNTVLIGPIDCGLFREMSFHVTALGTGINPQAQVSNDGASWVTVQGLRADSGAVVTSLNVLGVLYSFPTSGAKFWRVIAVSAQTSGTTTLVAYASQQATPKLYQSVTLATTANVNVVSNAPSSSTGFNTYHSLVSAATTNATNVKTSAGNIGTCVLTNTSTTFKYVKFFNLTTAPTMGTSTPVIQFPIPPNSTLDVGTSFAGIRFSAGISYATTNGSALLDNTAVGAGEVLVNLAFA